MRRISVAVAATLLLCVLAGHAWAEEAGKPEWTVRTWGAYQGRADVEDDRGSMAESRAGVEAAWRWFTLAYEARSFDFEDPARLPFGNGQEPFDTLHALSLSAQQGGALGGRWSWFGGASLDSGFEEEMDGSLSGSVRGGVGYALAEDATLRLGAAASVSPLGARGLPVLALAVNRKAEAGWSALVGVPSTEVRYRWGGRFATRAALSLDDGTWRLADDSPMRRKGYFSESGLTAGLYQDVDLTEAVFASLGLTWSFRRSLEVYNDEGDKSGEWDLDPALGAVLHIGIRF